MLWTLECTAPMRPVAEVVLRQEPLERYTHQAVVFQWAVLQPTLWGPPLRPPLRA